MKTIASEIRLAEADDAGTLASVHAVAWEGAYRGILPHRSLSAMIARRGADWWRRAIEARASILVVEFGGEIVGYATLGRNRTAALTVEGEVYEIYLRPEFQGIGFGRRLFDAARALLRSRGLRGLVVWALEDNDAALRFYESCGGVDIAAGSESFEGRTVRKVAYTFA